MEAPVIYRGFLVLGPIRLLPPERVVSVKLWLVAHRDLIRTARVRAVMSFLAEIGPSRSGRAERRIVARRVTA